MNSRRRRLAVAAAGATALIASAAIAATPVVVDWIAPASLPGSGPNADRPQVTMSADGSRLAAVWTQTDGTNGIWASASIDGGVTWTNATALSNTTVNAEFPQIVASADGLQVSAIWYTYVPPPANKTAVRVRHSSDGGQTWSPAATVDVVDLAAENPQIAGSADGTRLTAVWAYDTTERLIGVSSSSDSGASWSDPPITLSDITKNAGDPQVATSASGLKSFVVYTENDSVHQRVKARSADDGGLNWDGPATLSGAGQGASEPQVAVSDSGSRATVVWSRSDGTHDRLEATSTSNGGLDWSNPVDVSEPGGNVQSPQLAASSDGTHLTAIWQESDGADLRVKTAASSDAGATWTTPVTQSLLGTTADNPQVAVSADGSTTTAAWYLQRPGDTNIVESVSSGDGGTTWTAPEAISDTANNADDPDVVTTTDGRGILTAWAGSDGTNDRIWASVGSLSTVPGAPGKPSATAGDAQLTASWTPPADDGGSAITGYTATVTPGGQMCSTATTSCTITGLANGTAHTVSVRATNAVGSGPASATSDAVTPSAPTPPLAPAPAPDPDPTPEPDPPSTKVKAKAVDGDSKLKVKIKPDLGKKKQWEFVIKVKKKGDWKTIKTKKDKTKVYETEGSDHTLTVNLDEGKYKAKSKEARGHLADTSDVVKLKK